MTNEKAKRIAELNDSFRKTFRGGLVVLTRGVEESPHRDRILQAVREYQFHGIDGNNPYGENDFGVIVVEGERYYFKIDYYDQCLQCHSPDKADPKVTKRVMTIMKADEY